METPNNLSESQPKCRKNMLLPFIIVAEIGLAIWQIGYCCAIDLIYILGAIPAVAAIVFTILYALNIKPRFCVVAIMICIALTIVIFFAFVAAANFSTLTSQKNQLINEEREEIREFIQRAVIHTKSIICCDLLFVIFILPLSIYLPICYLKKTSNR